MKNSLLILVLLTAHFSLNAQVPADFISYFRGVIALKSDNGKWLTLCNGCQKSTAPYTLTVHQTGEDFFDLPNESLFYFENNIRSEEIALRAENGKYLARCNGCVSGGPADILTAHSNSSDDEFALFSYEKLDNGKFVFKADNGKYLARCNGCSPGSTVPDIVAIHESNKNALWAQWEVKLLDPIFRTGQYISLKSDSGKWLSLCKGCQKSTYDYTATVHMTGDASALPQEAKFVVEVQQNGRIRLKAINNKYLARCNGCVTGGPADIVAMHIGIYDYMEYASFYPKRLDNGKYVFKSDNGKLLARCNGCSPGSSVPDIVAIHETNENSPWAQWEVVFHQQ